jgi:branched-chain amino acid transport system permease protein
MDMSTAVTLFVNGLALGAILFLLASGLTLIFGLMNVVNFAHGAFFLVGAYVAVKVLDDSVLSMLLAFVAAAAAVAAIGYVVERFFLRRFYGLGLTAHLRQLLLTLGLTLVITEILRTVEGPNVQATGRLPVLDGTVSLPADGYVQGFRLLAVVIGLAIFAVIWLVLQRTRTGLVVRAGVEDSGMVQALGIDVSRAFMLLFVLGSAMAGFGGAVAAMYYGGAHPELGNEHLILAFGIVVLGGLGSYLGAAVGSLMVALLSSYVGYLWPDGLSFAVIGLMAALLVIRPQGLFGKAASRV